MPPPFLRVILCTITLVVFSSTLLTMWKGKAAFIALLITGSANSQAGAQCNSGSRPVSLQWHPPNATTINNLTAIINGTGVFGFQFTAVTPSSVPYRTYNWCSMPHVRQEEYVVPPPEYELEYVEVVGPC